MAAPRDERERALRDHLKDLLGGGGAHLDFNSVIDGFPEATRGVRPEGAPHSGWELLEHLRIAQWDILEFSRDARHVSPDWPSGYWPSSPEPPNAAAWDRSVASFRSDLEAMIRLVAAPESDLYARFKHGDGQTLLREALVLADHNSYHLGQLMQVRRQLESLASVRR